MAFSWCQVRIDGVDTENRLIMLKEVETGIEAVGWSESIDILADIELVKFSFGNQK